MAEPQVATDVKPEQSRKRPRSRSRSRSPPRQRKRPGATARITHAEKEQQEQRRRQREQEQQAALVNAAKDRGIQQGVTNFYNELQQRGRDWRNTESKIKNLRNYNNWAKSVLIHKFSPREDFTPGGGYGSQQQGLMVLDIGVGKGGDLQKWQKAPQRVQRYVGVDPAEVSINQARERHADMRRKNHRTLRADFFVQDGYGESLEKIDAVREVGFDPNVGPAVGGSSRWGGGGFDVVVMMFCMHYAFESLEKANGMLRNTSGALKKGGRFFGVIPNSDVLRENVQRFYEKQEKQEKQDPPQKAESDDSDEKVADESSVNKESGPQWGNSLYRVHFPTKTAKDGTFRPPFGWKYNYFLEEAVEVPEYVVPFEAFRALAEDYNLELQYKKPLLEIWDEERRDPELGRLSVLMRVSDRPGGELNLSQEEREAVALYHAFCFYKV